MRNPRFTLTRVLKLCSPAVLHPGRGHKLLETRCASAEVVRWSSSNMTPIQLGLSKAGSPGFLDLDWHLMAVWESVLHCDPTVPAAGVLRPGCGADYH